MSWLQLIIEAQPSQIGAIQDYLDAAGALAVTLEDAGDEPLYEPPPGASPLWTQTRVVGLFPADARMETVVKGLGESLGAMPPHRLCALEDRNWTRTWLDHFHPMRFGERLWVCPSGYLAPDPTAATVYLDPGLAFGTGTHPTTALCLEWLDANPPRGSEAVDYGCGSGILALAALRLGASHVWAVDNDPQALLATADNARKNGIRCHDMRQSPPWRPAAGSPAPSLSLVPPERLPAVQVDVVIANILARPLVSLASYFATLARPGGRIVLSGILEGQGTEVGTAYREWFALDPPTACDGWLRLSGTRRARP